MFRPSLVFTRKRGGQKKGEVVVDHMFQPDLVLQSPQSLLISVKSVPPPVTPPKRCLQALTREQAIETMKCRDGPMTAYMSVSKQPCPKSCTHAQTELALKTTT